MDILFTVPFSGTVSQDGTELKGTRSQLLQLIKDADATLKRATELCNMKPPVVENGTLSFDSVQDFFRQAYPERTHLGVHATPLFKHLLKAARSGAAPKAYCSVCKKTPRERSCSDKKPHSENYKRFLIEVSSLKKYIDSVINDRTPHPRGLGDGLKNDLKALNDKL